MNRRLALMKILNLANKSAVKVSEAAATNSTKTLRYRYQSEQEAFTIMGNFLNQLRAEDLEDLRARMNPAKTLAERQAEADAAFPPTPDEKELAGLRHIAPALEAADAAFPPTLDKTIDGKGEFIVRDGDKTINLDCAICCMKSYAPIATAKERDILREHFSSLGSHEAHA